MTHWMFEQVRQRDQNVTLFLNEYAIMSQGTMTQVSDHVISCVTMTLAYDACQR